MDFCLSLQCLESLVKIAQGCVDEELPIDACTLAFHWQVQILSLLAGSSLEMILRVSSFSDLRYTVPRK